MSCIVLYFIRAKGYVCTMKCRFTSLSTPTITDEITANDNANECLQRYRVIQGYKNNPYIRRRSITIILIEVTTSVICQGTVRQETTSEFRYDYLERNRSFIIEMFIYFIGHTYPVNKGIVCLYAASQRGDPFECQLRLIDRPRQGNGNKNCR